MFDIRCASGWNPASWIRKQKTPTGFRNLPAIPPSGVSFWDQSTIVDISHLIRLPEISFLALLSGDPPVHQEEQRTNGVSGSVNGVRSQVSSQKLENAIVAIETDIKSC